MTGKRGDTKQDRLIKLLSGDEYFTLDESVEAAGLKLASVKNYVKYYFKRLGYDVEVSDKLGQLGYRVRKK